MTKPSPSTPRGTSIGVGDLVMVVRGHSCVVGRLGGVPFRVTAMRPQSGGGWHCNACNTPDIAPEEMYGATLDFHTQANKAIPAGWLRRIPPIEELEGVKSEEDIREPA